MDLWILSLCLLDSINCIVPLIVQRIDALEMRGLQSIGSRTRLLQYGWALGPGSFLKMSHVSGKLTLASGARGKNKKGDDGGQKAKRSKKQKDRNDDSDDDDHDDGSVVIVAPQVFDENTACAKCAILFRSVVVSALCNAN